MNPKLAVEQYQNMGGMNIKYSPYITGPMEFLNLINFDFQTPGSLTQRWGSTQYMGQTFVSTITSLYEYGRLEGQSYLMVGVTGAIFAGATTGAYQGISFIGQTSFIDTFTAGYGSDLDFVAGLTCIPQMVPYLGSVPRSSLPEIVYFGETIGPNITSYAVLDDYLFGCNGNQFWKFDGTTTCMVGLPAPVGLLPWASNVSVIGPTIYNSAGATDIGIGSASQGNYAFFASWVNQRGFESQIWPVAGILATAGGVSIGGTFVQVQAYFPIPSQYNPASLNLYSYYTTTSGVQLSMGATTTWNSNYTLLANYPIGGPGSSIPINSSLAIINSITHMILYLGSTLGGQTFMQGNAGFLPDPIVNTYYPLGQQILSNLFTVVPYCPQYLDVYQNRLFLGGFSATPSTVVFSDAGEPEGYPLANSFEVRTNDADYLTALRAYGTRMYFFKKNSFHELTGDNPNNFFLQEKSAQYGCLNNRCTAIFDDTLWFLDRKGVVQFNGAQFSVISTKMQPIFDTMNYSVALKTACMIHDKLRNQIMTAIPVNGATINNQIIVYDYVAGAWTTYQGAMPSCYATVQGYNNTKNAFYGSYSGTVNWYGSSFTSDNGAGFTLYLKSRFLKPMGETVEEQYRRLYLNADYASATLAMPCNFYQDYGSSIVLSTTFILGAFQDRIDFGIPARSLAFEIYQLSTTSPLRLHGFSVATRMQRKV